MAVVEDLSVKRERQSMIRECELVMVVRAASPLYSGDDRVARPSLSRQLWALARVALSPRIPIVWAMLLSIHSYRLVFLNELTTINEYLSRLSSVGENAPESFPASHAFH